MKTLRFILGLVTFIVVVPVIAVAIFLATFDANALKRDLTAQISQKLGRSVAVNGDVGLDFKDGLMIRLDKVEIGSPAGFAAKDFVSIGRLQAYLNWKALVRREIDVRSVSLSDARITLQTNAAGHNNWDVKIKESRALPAPGAARLILASAEVSNDEVVDAAKKEIGNLMEGKKPDFKIQRVALNSLELRNTVIIYSDARSGKSQTVAFDRGLFKMPLEGAFSATAAGKYNGAAFDADVTAEKGVQDLISGKATPVDLKATYMGEPYAVKAMLARSPNTVELTSMSARVKGLDAEGLLRVATGGVKPSVNGSLSIPVLDLTKMGKASAAVPRVQELAAAMPRPDALLVAAATPAPDLSVLKAVNAEVKLAIGQLIASPTLTLDKVSTLAKIAGGVLRLDDLAFSFLGTPYKGMASVDGTGAVMATHVVLNGSAIDFPAVARAFGSKMPLDSKGDLAADLTFSGHTPEAMTRSLSGKIEVVMGAGTLDTGGTDQMAVGLAKFMFPKGAVQNNPKISCAAMRFNAANGVLKSNGMVADSNVATVGVDGSIDLAGQSLNLVLRPVPKGLQGSDLFVVPARVTGATAHPTFMPEEGAIMNKATAIISGNRQPINTGVPKVDAATSKGNACLAALNNPQPIMITPPTAKEAVQQVKEQAKEVIQLGKDVFKDSRDAARGDSTKQEQVIDKLKQLKSIFGQ